MIVSKAKTTLLILFILFSALLWAVKPVKAMRRESDLQTSPQTAIAQAEVRVILIGKRW